MTTPSIQLTGQTDAMSLSSDNSRSVTDQPRRDDAAPAPCCRVASATLSPERLWRRRASSPRAAAQSARAVRRIRATHTRVARKATPAGPGGGEVPHPKSAALLSHNVGVGDSRGGPRRVGGVEHGDRGRWGRTSIGASRQCLKMVASPRCDSLVTDFKGSVFVLEANKMASHHRICAPMREILLRRLTLDSSCRFSDQAWAEKRLGSVRKMDFTFFSEEFHELQCFE